MTRLPGVTVCVCGRRAVLPGEAVCRTCAGTQVPPRTRGGIGPMLGKSFIHLLDAPRMPPDAATFLGEPALTVVAYGEPAAQGSKKYVGKSKRTGRAILVEQSKAVKPWRETVQEAVEASVPAGWVPLEWAVAVALDFTMKRPKRFPTGATAAANADFRHEHGLPSAGKDADKLERAVFDALTKAKAWRDDSRVTDVVQKRLRYVGHRDALPEPGVKVRLWLVPEGT